MRPVQSTPIFTRQPPSKSTMPSMRRIKVFGLVALAFVVTILFLTKGARDGGDMGNMGDFYQKTKIAMERAPIGGGSTIAGAVSKKDEEVARAMSERLKEAAQVAKDNANAKSPKPDAPSKIVGVGSAADGAGKGVAGRKKYAAGGAEAQEPIQEEKPTQQEQEVQAELNNILKKSPIIIFSKSFCPHSKRAKIILLDKYLIEPQPYVVELNQHNLGPQLQAKLAELTGRRTVPNVLINGVSIGGGDEVAELDSGGTLIDKVRDLGGKRMTEVKIRPIGNSKEDEKQVEKTEEEKVNGHGLRR
ncbi:hypothetical protein LZ554_005039 [Drepanopeziza brunnea f. sp. 'monogermtubi']|nr:hypothetical protein LZ554_005039 [Drepanopeziza brunnea f. sp. 'monogermtubi']